MTVEVSVAQERSSIICTTWNLKQETISTALPPMNTGLSVFLFFPEVHHNRLCFPRVQGQIVGGEPCRQIVNLMPVCCLVVAGNHPCCAISELWDGVCSIDRTTGEERTAEGSTHAPVAVQYSGIQGESEGSILPNWSSRGGCLGSSGVTCLHQHVCAHWIVMWKWI